MIRKAPVAAYRVASLDLRMTGDCCAYNLLTGPAAQSSYMPERTLPWRYDCFA